MSVDYRQRIERMLHIITLIQGGRRWTAHTLAAELGCVPRTLFRDLSHLRACGIPISYDSRTRQYAMQGQYFMPPLQLSLDESLALAALCEHVGEREQIPFLKAAGRAAQKIESQLPAELRSDLAVLRGSVAIRTAAAMEPDGYLDVYDRMQQAIARRRLLRCKYEPAAGDDERARRGVNGEFDLAPYALFFCVRAWYVIGQRSDRDSLRCLKLSRFTKVQPTETSFTRPRGFSLDRYLGNAWRMMRGKDAEVELWFDPRFADTIADTHWHKTQEFARHPDGSCTFTAKVSGFEEIVWWILSMGPHCKVIKPKALAARVRELAAATAAAYAP